MNVLSLFDGMSCGQIALERAGIKVDNYFASEIDKHAIKVTMSNYPNTIQLGDVTKIDTEELPKIDLLIGGSPCQSISTLGDRTGLEGKSSLFFHYLRCLKELKPKYFLLENVVGSKKAIDEISKLVGVEPVLFNSNLVSGQNRARYYWTNIKFELPTDKGILLKDVLDSNPRDTCILTPGRFKWLTSESGANSIKKRYTVIDPIKANCLTARGDASWNCNYVTRDDYGLTKLTPEEYEKLQTVPVGYTSTARTSERYKMLGNGWTVDVIAHILKGIKEQRRAYVHKK
jgi:DNA (cytosine-5)-methyltransferase 3A